MQKRLPGDLERGSAKAKGRVPRLHGSLKIVPREKVGRRCWAGVDKRSGRFMRQGGCEIYRVKGVGRSNQAASVTV